MANQVKNYQITNYSCNFIDINGLPIDMDGIIGNIDFGVIQKIFDEEPRGGQLQVESFFVGLEKKEIEIPFYGISTELANSISIAGIDGTIGFQTNAPAVHRKTREYLQYWARVFGQLSYVPIVNLQVQKQAEFKVLIIAEEIEWKLGNNHHVKIVPSDWLWLVNGVNVLEPQRRSMGLTTTSTNNPSGNL